MKWLSHHLRLAPAAAIGAAVVFFTPCSAAAQDTIVVPALDTAGVPVIVGGTELFRVRTRVLEFDAADRADRVRRRIRDAARANTASDSIRAVAGEDGTDLMAGPVVVMTITQRDAVAEGLPLDSLVALRVDAIRGAVITLQGDMSLKSLLIGAGLSVLTLLILGLLFRLLAVVAPKVRSMINGARETHIPSIRIQKFEVLPAARVADVLVGLTRIVHIAAVVAILWVAIPLLLSFFPLTRPFAGRFVAWVQVPLRSVAAAALGYLPNLFYILVIAGVMWLVLRMVRVLFVELARGTISFTGFYREWAIPTYKIVRFLGIAFTVVLIMPYLPGADSDAFKGVGLFLGVLFSLGSTGAIANVVAGVILTYTRAFQVGDRVKIADTIGDIREKTLLATRVMTPKGVEITVPNAMVLSSHITNYSANDRGIALHTTVTIGYDVEWRRVHELLKSAATEIEGLLEKPDPYVLQNALGDHSVSYELNVYTDKPKRMPELYSLLHQRIQDVFDEAGVEIMSPAYHALRDGNDTTVPSVKSKPGYRAPGFKIDPAGGPAQSRREVPETNPDRSSSG